ncbi:4-hydroxy-tetrahydrodipicolinate synthase [Nisaea acidiphila]|uniref:4-hydroxy-tetrahydrodipicolinate synthase n=1 Tax=Nisaea acidiphila TaxID=1862145 RepID=A0A9J7ASW4_9PROT|nr:4-hydroxy-tetrahydrodipicolinate synthase [Nisaea acidiphila]UUX50424.1 4-hydroxy-tetrahydrodipicolinate synthase [Nisaea acidiphila]
MFKGSLVALITPFKNGAVDEAAFRKFVDWQIEQGTDGLIPTGTTGESPTLSHEEHKQVVEICIDQAAGRVPVIAGTGSNSTEEAIELTQHAKEAGADAALIVTPYYNKPTQEGMYRHFKAIADAVDIPILIYNIPPRSVIDMSVDTMKRLSEIPNIVGVKDATASATRPIETRLAIGPDFCQLSGEDGTVVPYLSQGGHGCISVTANVAPGPLSEMHRAWRSGDLDTVMTINDRLYPLHQALFCESSPGPVKYAASLLGICEATARLPICEIADSSKQKVESALRHAGLLN